MSDTLRILHVINGMSANTGMRWDIEYTKKLIGYEPLDDVTRPDSSA